MPENPTPPLENLLAHRRWVQGVARRLLRDEHAAEDLAQEAWMRALRSPPDPERDPKPWLRRVLKNLASNVRRGDGRRQAHERTWRETRETRSPGDLVAEAEQHKRLVTLLLDLEEPFKTALVMRFYEGLGPREIAERLGVPVGTVHSRIARAVERLKNRLDEEEHGDRRAWIAALLPIAGLDRMAPAAAATVPATSLFGILAMSLSKPKIAFLTLLLLGALVPGGLWLASLSRGEDPTDDAHASRPLVRVEAPVLEGRDLARVGETASPLTHRPGGEPSTLDRAAQIVRGTVRDAAGNPIPDAELYVLPKDAPGLDAGDLADARIGRVRSRQDGSFALPVTLPFPARLLAFAPGHTAVSVELHDAGKPVEVALGEPWRLRVRLLDENDRWPADCEVDIYDGTNDSLDRAVDPSRQAVYVEVQAPDQGNTQEVALHRAGTVQLVLTLPRGAAAAPPSLEITPPTDEVSVRILRSGQLTVRLLDATTGEPIADDQDCLVWMGRRADGVTVWNYGSRGHQYRQDTRIAPGRYDLEFVVHGYLTWKGEITFHEEGEARTLDVRLEPRQPNLSEGSLFLRFASGETAPRPLLDFARLRATGKPFAERMEMYARLRTGDLEAWQRTWGTSGGWANLDPRPQEDGSFRIRQAIYPRDDARMPAGTYDIYVAERNTGRAAFLSGVQVIGDQESRYDVTFEPGTMFSIRDVLPGDETYTGLVVRTTKTGQLPLTAMEADSTHSFNIPTSLEFLLRAPRKPLRLGPFPAASIEVEIIDGDGKTTTLTVRGAGTIVREAR